MLEPLYQQIFLAVLIGGVFLAFIREWWPVEIVAMWAFFLCVVFGILPVVVPALPDPGWSEAAKLSRLELRQEALHYSPWNVFSHPAPLIVACMFVLSAALERTGVVEGLGQWFERVAATNPTRMLASLVVLCAILSAFMNNTPVVVVFLPIIIAICNRKDWIASRFLIPLSYAAIVGGTVTIVGTSTNLVVAGTWREQLPDREPFSMFEFSVLGMAFIVVTLIYLLTLGKRLLPDRITLAALIDNKPEREFITHAIVREGSSLIGSTLGKSQLSSLTTGRILALVRNGQRLPAIHGDFVFESGDEIVFKGTVEGLAALDAGSEVDVGLEAMHTESAVLMEGIIGPGSAFEGKSLKDLDFQQRFGVFVLAVHRRGENLRERFDEIRLSFGDTLLVQGSAENMGKLFEVKDFINLSQSRGRILRRNKAPIAIMATAGFMVAGALMGFGLVPRIPIIVLAMAAALFVLGTRCLSPREAYQSIEWRVVFLIMGMLGLGMAVDRSGLDDVIGIWIKDHLGTENPYMLIAALYLLSAVLTELISNNAVAALLAPIAIAIGVAAGVDPKPLVVAVMFGASASFVTPIGYQTNTFVYGAGGYRFSDFFRTGFPLAILLWLVATFLIPVLWPL